MSWVSASRLGSPRALDCESHDFGPRSLEQMVCRNHTAPTTLSTCPPATPQRRMMRRAWFTWSLALPMVLLAAACEQGPYGIEFQRKELPVRDYTIASGQAPPMGNIAYQPPFLPIEFSIDSNGEFHVHAVAEIVTVLGKVTVSGRVVTLNGSGSRLSDAASDVTQLIVCLDSSGPGSCTAYQIGTGRKLTIELDGRFVETVERNRTIIRAISGSTILVSDAGPPQDLRAHGPARKAIERVDFSEFGPHTEIDLEGSQGGTTSDIAYDHIDGTIAPINTAMVSRVSTDQKRKLGLRDLPSEMECQQATDWVDHFTAEQLRGPLIACIRTAESDLGYVVLWPDVVARRPQAYLFYSFVWVR